MPSGQRRQRLTRRVMPWGASRLRWMILVGLVMASVIPELLLEGADLGLWGSPEWRRVAYENMAFWPGLLGNWRENWTGQRWAMFLSYGFLHAGLMHLVTNMITLVSLGGPLVDRLGALRFSLAYAMSIFGGALGFALLSHGLDPMVGASGALFGLAGGVIECAQADLREDGVSRAERLRALTGPVGILVALNLVMYWAMHGQLAWQTHLGGFLAGALATRLLAAR
ncbi:rhomboid family intramembrane serine protease [Frigidibacter sp. MR17.14]|uniref:rhomboid family intramembrane serine protease n=1 Tax=Frigidibacter sp. MR17.14 TaxID=3126509 RepID=UPI003012AD99